MAFGPSDSSANGAPHFQPVGNAPGQRRKNLVRAEGPPYHPRLSEFSQNQAAGF